MCRTVRIGPEGGTAVVDVRQEFSHRVLRVFCDLKMQRVKNFAVCLLLPGTCKGIWPRDARRDFPWTPPSEKPNTRTDACDAFFVETSCSFVFVFTCFYLLELVYSSWMCNAWYKAGVIGEMAAKGTRKAADLIRTTKLWIRQRNNEGQFAWWNSFSTDPYFKYGTKAQPNSQSLEGGLSGGMARSSGWSQRGPLWRPLAWRWETRSSRVFNSVSCFFVWRCLKSKQEVNVFVKSKQKILVTRKWEAMATANLVNVTFVEKGTFELHENLAEESAKKSIRREEIDMQADFKIFEPTELCLFAPP